MIKHSDSNSENGNWSSLFASLFMCLCVLSPKGLRQLNCFSLFSHAIETCVFSFSSVLIFKSDLPVHFQIHPSIHFLYPLNPTQGRRLAGAYPSCHWARGRVHPGPVASPSQGHTETNNHPCSHSLLGSILSHQLTWHACFGAVGGHQSNCCIHGENMQTPHKKASAGIWTRKPLATSWWR